MTDGKQRHVGLNFDHQDLQTRDERGAAIFGFWVFLMSDALIFALLFATYGVMLSATMGGPTPASEFKLGPAFAETLILLSSSLSYGMASVAVKHGMSVRQVLGWLAVTLALGAAFLALELKDFAEMASHGAVPARSGFLSAFFALVPLHGLHVLVGCVWITVMMAQLAAFGPDARVKINLLRLGLFWHFLDIVWIAIFSSVYLPGVIR